MEQRPLRLGDILDDYCPRERRVTNHAIVAMIEDDIRQTRCTTCDAEHAYKGGKAPRRRARKETPAALYKEVLAGLPDLETPPVVSAAAVAAEPVADTAAVEEQQRAALPVSPVPPAVYDSPPAPEPDTFRADAGDAAPAPVEEGPVHRRLIRATLPRPEGQKEARPIPEFTMRQPLGRGRFRGGDGRGRLRGHGGNANGTAHRTPGGSRFGTPRPGGRRNRGR